jgi:hypothetical protein
MIHRILPRFPSSFTLIPRPVPPARDSNGAPGAETFAGGGSREGRPGGGAPLRNAAVGAEVGAGRLENRKKGSPSSPAAEDVIRPFCITILYHNLLLFIDIFHI